MNKRTNKGITLITLVITIIVLILLAGISLSFALGDNGIIAKAKQASFDSKLSDIREKIIFDLSSAQMDAIAKEQELSKESIRNIISKYGVLQEDDDTIKLNDIEAELKLSEIWSSLSYGGNYIGGLKGDISLIDTQTASAVRNTTKSFSVEKGSKYFIVALCSPSNRIGCGFNTPIFTVTPSSSFNCLLQNQFKGSGVSSSNVSWYCSYFVGSFIADEDTIDVYLYPHQVDSSVLWNMQFFLFKIS